MSSTTSKRTSFRSWRGCGDPRGVVEEVRGIGSGRRRKALRLGRGRPAQLQAQIDSQCAVIRSGHGHHIHPPCGLGARAGSLAQKTHALLHSDHLESSSWKRTQEKLSLTLTFTGDLGTELGITRVREVNIAAKFPWWDSDALRIDDAENEVLRVGFSDSVYIPGMFHIIDSMCDHLLRTLIYFEDIREKLAAFAMFFHHKHTRDLFSKKCVEGTEDADFGFLFQSGGPPVLADGRVWGVHAQVISWALARKVVLQQAWDAHKMRHGEPDGGGGGQQGDGEDIAVRVMRLTD